MNRLRRFFWVMMLAFTAFITWAFTTNDFELAKHLDIYYSTVKEVLINYVDEVDAGEMIENSIHGMLAKLDPYTNYIPENSLEDYKVMTTGEYGGLGAFFRQKDGKTYITECYEDGPAAKAGLKPGDIILKVNDMDIFSRSYEELEDIFLGQPGTKINLEIQRPGEGAVKKLEVAREKIEMKSVPHYEIMGDGVAYINLSSFTTKAYTEVYAAFEEMKKTGKVKSLILDLRGNPGGLLMEAVRIVNLFVPKGQEVVSTRGKVSVHNKTFNTTADPYDPEIPIVVLVNSQSASASEIVAGCLQDLDRGVIMGTRTFGKGLVQQTIDLSYNSKLKITTAKYYIPSGRCIQALDYSHKNPDGSVASIPDSLIKVFYTKNGRPVKDGGGIVPDVTVNQDTLSELVIKLLQEDIIFDYVTQYSLKQNKLPEPDVFAVNEAIFRDFSDYVKIQDFSYETYSQKKFREWKESLREEGIYESEKNRVDEMERIIAPNMLSLLQRHRAQVEDELASELMLRYYQKSGQIEYIIHHDPMVQTAMNLLSDTTRYQKVFRP